jgi:hypothetical protein
VQDLCHSTPNAGPLPPLLLDCERFWFFMKPEVGHAETKIQSGVQA